MKKNFINVYSVFTAVFVLLVIGMGAVSMMKLARFYVNDEIDYNEWSANLGSRFETDVASTFFQKFNFINFNGAIRRMLGMKEMNGVVKLNNGYLLTTNSKRSEEKLQEYAEHIAKAKEELNKNGIEFLYTVTPYTLSKYDNQLPVGVKDFGNDNIDVFCNFLAQNGVDFIDFRQELYKDGIDQYKMMYKTDHHWTHQMGFYAFCKIANKIEEKLGTKLDAHLTDFNNYNVTTYKKWHLGSRGQRTGRFFAGIDNFDLITPKFETRIEKNGTLGNYETQLINMHSLQSKDYTSRYTYDYVLGGSLQHFYNLNATNNIKVALISDSMGKAVAPFLDISYAECKYFSFNSKLKDLIEYKPDIVVEIILGTNINGYGGKFDFD